MSPRRAWQYPGLSEEAVDRDDRVQDQIRAWVNELAATRGLHARWLEFDFGWCAKRKIVFQADGGDRCSGGVLAGMGWWMRVRVLCDGYPVAGSPNDVICVCHPRMIFPRSSILATIA